MAKAIVTLKIMPISPEVNLEEVQTKALNEIAGFAGETETKIEIEPIAFGLKALKIIFVMDESKGATDPLEEKIQTIEGVQSVEVIDVRRAIG
ncbi:elongation factor 1-beta [Candidatus Woesearchaeota archaeon]|nr:elongation factor 1-beta [Candidatus Woesearchaeota archaeon]